MTQLLLHRCWNDLWPNAAPGRIQYAWNMVERHYLEPHRHYHTLVHVHDMIKILCDSHLINGAPESQRQAVLIATFFHDVIYEPYDKDNEEKSAALLMTLGTELRVTESVLSQASRLVRLTRDHFDRPPGLEAIAHIFLDVDLEILSAMPERYEKYAEGIRKEYQSVTDRIIHYDSRRLVFLEKVLHSATIYWTRDLGACGEWDARSNITNEINQIKARNGGQSFPDIAPSPAITFLP